MDHTVISQMINVPFLEKGRGLSGFDCWGVVRFGLLHGCGIEVPSYTEDYTTTQEGDEIRALIAHESLGWSTIPLSEARPGDVLLLRIKGQPWHCGLVIDPPYFVHAARGVGTVRERWDGMLWQQRIIGLYRHPALRREALAHTVQ